jgi:2,3-dihydroxybiphenyl 1,2-dioxygenase
MIKFADPSGILSEIFYGPLVIFDKPFQSPRPLSGFKTGDQGLGHFVISVDDFDRSLHFYRDVLGMRISDFVNLSPAPNFKMKVAFFHCNPRHHTIAFAQMPGVSRRLHHFMLQLQSLNDVGTTYDLCQAQDVPIVIEAGEAYERPHGLVLSADVLRIQCGVRLGRPRSGRRHLARAGTYGRQHLGSSGKSVRLANFHLEEAGIG